MFDILSISTRRGAARELYIDSVNGDDANHGRRVRSPVRTLSHASSLIRPGERIHLLGGFRDRLIVAEDGVEIDCNECMIDGADVVDPSAWSKTGGYTNIYQTTYSVQPDVRASEWPGLWVDGARLTWGTDLATMDSLPGTFWHDDVTDLSSVTVYMHGPESEDPRTSGFLYEASVRANAVDLFDSQHSVVRNFLGKRPYTSTGALQLGRNCRAENALSLDGNTHNIFWRTGCELVDCEARDAYNHTTAPTLYIGFENSIPGGAIASLTRCVARSTSYYANCIGFYDHGGGAFAGITYQDCESHNVGSPFAGADADLIEIIGGSISNFSVAFAFLCDAEVSDIALALAKVGGRIANLGGADRRLILDGINAEMHTTGMIRSTFARTHVELLSSRVVGANTILSGNQADQVWVSRENTFEPAGRMSLAYNLTGSGLSLDSDYNAFGGMTGEFAIGADTHPDFDTYVLETGQDTHSTNEPPPPPELPATSFLSTGLFTDKDGGWWEIGDLSTLFEDDAETTPATLDGPVGKVIDKSGALMHFRATGDARPTLRQDGNGRYYLELDNIDDFLEAVIDPDARPDFTLKLPIYMACALSKGSQVGQALFGVIVSGADYCRIVNVATNNRLQSQIRHTSIANVGVSSADVSVPVDTAVVVDGLHVPGTSDIAINGGTPLTVANTWAADTETAGASLGVNLVAVGGGMAQPVHFYGGIIVKAEPTPEERAAVVAEIASYVGVAV